MEIGIIVIAVLTLVVNAIAAIYTVLQKEA